MTYSVLAHYFLSFGLAFSLTQGLRLKKVWAWLMVSGLGVAWEFGLQSALAKVLPWWDPQPDPFQLLEWMAGAASGLLLVWVLERRRDDV